MSNDFRDRPEASDRLCRRQPADMAMLLASVSAGAGKNSAFPSSAPPN